MFPSVDFAGGAASPETFGNIGTAKTSSDDRLGANAEGGTESTTSGTSPHVPFARDTVSCDNSGSSAVVSADAVPANDGASTVSATTSILSVADILRLVGTTSDEVPRPVRSTTTTTSEEEMEEDDASLPRPATIPTTQNDSTSLLKNSIASPMRSFIDSPCFAYVDVRMPLRVRWKFTPFVDDAFTLTST